MVKEMKRDTAREKGRRGRVGGRDRQHEEEEKGKA